MKKGLIILSVSLAVSPVFAQGLVNFFNNPATLVSIGIPGGPFFWAPSSYYFGLFTAPAGTTDPSQFTFSGLYGTNQVAPGRFTGGFSVAVPGWEPGTTRSFLVAGWSRDMGRNWSQSWLSGNLGGSGFFGLSQIDTGAPGGFDGTGTLPPLNIFGGATGIQSGFALYPVPEPTTAAVAALGGAMWMLCRRSRNKKDAAH